MQRSTYISAGGHAVLLGAALFGGVFNAEPLELPTTQVSVISAEEFAALTRAPDLDPEPTPEPTPEVQQTVPPIAEPVTEPEPVPIQPAPEPELPRPDPIPEPVPTPVIPEPPAPIPDPTPIPEPDPEPEPLPEPDPAPIEETVVVIPDLAPDASRRPKERPSDRIAAEATPSPDPTVAIDNSAQAATTPDEVSEAPVEEQQETAPEEAASEIVTEAETPNPNAVSGATRPRARPQRPEATQTAAAPDASGEEAQAPSVSASSVNAALAQALGEPEAPTGPALSSGEVAALTAAIRGCWAVDIGNPAMTVVLDVYFKFDEAGAVVPGSLRLHEFVEGNEDAVETAFQFARRAIFRCQREGYPTLAQKFGSYDEIIVRFNPEKMRLR